MVESRGYLFIGDDEQAKRKEVDLIKRKYLDKGLKDIDFEIVYSQDNKLTPPIFDETLSYLPTNPLKKRIVFIKEIEALSKENRDVLIKHLKNYSKSIVFLLESKKLKIEEAFAKELSPFVKRVCFNKKKALGVFDLTEAITQRKTTQALSILNTLLNNREKPQNILGGLFWQWDNIKERLSLDKFKQGLNLLLDTDIRIKTGKLNEALALELAVIRLSYLA